MLGVILAAGRATRLGPLAAQLNKSLVTVGAKPMLVRQVQQLREAGCDYITVVVSPGAQDQVDCVIERAGLPNVSTVVQVRAIGPGNAIAVAIGEARSSDEAVIVMTADTLLEDFKLSCVPDESVITAPAPSTRPWCYHDGSTWLDAEADRSQPVAVGVYRFGNAGRLLQAAAFATPGFANEIQISTVLNAYGGMVPLWVPSHTWHDVGDIPALARANREFFIARDFHGVSMTEPGIVTKQGVTAGELEFMTNPPGSSSLLVPRAWPVPPRDGQLGYQLEYVDSPSLAELWLYWPSTPDMWRHVGANLVHMLRTHLWSRGDDYNEDMVGRATRMYHDKLLERYDPWPVELPQRDVLVVNGREIRAGYDLLEDVAVETALLAKTAPDFAGFIHGDPTFSNVLWSLKTGSFKLLDPRGEFGGPGALGDCRYDVAKIANSPFMAPIMHDLFDVRFHGARDGLDHWTFDLWPRRPEENDALVEPLAHVAGESVRDMRLLQLNQLLASAPLHPPDQARALYLLGCGMASRIIP